MPCDLRAYHIPIDSLQRLPPELISPIYDLVFRADLCCLAHSLNILRTSKSYYTSNIQRLYETVVLNDHNCKAFLGCWTDPREYDEKGIEVEVGSWNLATISSQIFPSDVEGPSPLVDNIPLSFHPASRRILLWRHCRTLHMDSVRAVRMAALADERLQGLPQPAVLNLYKPLEYPYPYPCLFPSLKRISLALPITQKLYNDPEPRTAAKYFDLSAQGGEEEPPVGDDFNTLLIPLRKGTVVLA
ncbi:hypothetical protein B9479_005741 [Cryptococcus floricola]|uniref:Uncharacterized protein n=1 Tax=Cryptococcus floricola TaxID=2591691 RepID=A0A5D3AU06_9TREE|nr:hypothetical protein B9479_005741 [Cryptococcus floricola]